MSGEWPDPAMAGSLGAKQASWTFFNWLLLHRLLSDSGCLQRTASSQARQ